MTTLTVHRCLLSRLACVSALFFGGSSALAVSQTLAIWDVAGNSPTAESVDVLQTADGVTAGRITAHGVNVLRYDKPAYGGVFVASGWSTTETIDAGKYFAWSLDAHGFGLESAIMSLSRGKYERDYDPDEPYGASKWALYVNGVYADMIDLDDLDGYGTAALPDQPVVWTADLSATDIADHYEFQLFGYSDGGGRDFAGLNESWYNHNGVNVSVTGTMGPAVPEPLTIVCLLLACASVGAYVKHRCIHP